MDRRPPSRPGTALPVSYSMVAVGIVGLVVVAVSWFPGRTHVESGWAIVALVSASLGAHGVIQTRLEQSLRPDASQEEGRKRLRRLHAALGLLALVGGGLSLGYLFWVHVQRALL